MKNFWQRLIYTLDLAQTQAACRVLTISHTPPTGAIHALRYLGKDKQG